MDLRCAPCTDRLITDGGDLAETDLPAAITTAPRVQMGPMGPLVIMLPICFACRKAELSEASKTGLIKA